MCIFRWSCLAGVVLALAASAPVPRLDAAGPDRGFTTDIPANFAGEEMRDQQDLWALDVSLKPMRMVYVPITNPRTGAKSSEMIWYLVYKVVNRPLPKQNESSDAVPVNVEDAPPPRMFVPKALLVTRDRDLHQAVADSIVPEALQAIVARERLNLKTSVQIAGALPTLTAADAKKENAEYGVFMFRGVDPRTTAFTVYLSGFSNAYKIGKDPSGKPLVLRRTISVPYVRLADEYDQFEKEIRQSGAPKWIYVPDESPAGRN